MKLHELMVDEETFFSVQMGVKTFIVGKLPYEEDDLVRLHLEAELPEEERDFEGEMYEDDQLVQVLSVESPFTDTNKKIFSIKPVDIK